MCGSRWRDRPSPSPSPSPCPCGKVLERAKSTPGLVTSNVYEIFFFRFIHAFGSLEAIMMAFFIFLSLFPSDHGAPPPSNMLNINFSCYVYTDKSCRCSNGPRGNFEAIATEEFVIFSSSGSHYESTFGFSQIDPCIRFVNWTNRLITIMAKHLGRFCIFINTLRLSIGQAVS